MPGRWPEASPADRETLTRLASAHRRVLIDGIIASAAPDELAQAAASGTEISVLVHLPLPAESGLGVEDAQRLTASERATVSAGYTVVCTSAWAQADLQARYGLDAVAVAEPGVDPAPLASGSTPARLLFLGAVTPRKNPLGLLQALRGSPRCPGPWSSPVRRRRILTMRQKSGPQPRHCLPGAPSSSARRRVETCSSCGGRRTCWCFPPWLRPTAWWSPRRCPAASPPWSAPAPVPRPPSPGTRKLRAPGSRSPAPQWIPKTPTLVRGAPGLAQRCVAAADVEHRGAGSPG